MRCPQICFLSLSLFAAALTSCSKDADEIVPLAGSIQSENPAAAALFQKAEGQEQAGQLGKAIKTYNSVYKNYPYSPQASDAMFRRATLQQRDGELLAAFESYQTFITRFPADSKYSLALAEQSKVAHAAADGIITNNFIGLKTKIDRTRTTEMLTQVIKNAPKAPSAAKAQFAIGELWAREGNEAKAIAAYREVGKEYPNSPFAPEAQYKIGTILIAQSEDGNQDVANMQAARRAFQDYLNLYPKGPRAGEVKAKLAQLGQADIANSLKVAKFYEGKNNIESAKFYYKEVIQKAKSGPLYNEAQARLSQLGG